MVDNFSPDVIRIWYHRSGDTSTNLNKLAFLPIPQQKHYGLIRSRKKQQYLDSRYLIFKALCELYETCTKDWQIQEKPHTAIQILNLPSAYISLSHSQEYACFAISHFPVGVDVETRTDRQFLHAAELFMSPSELSKFHTEADTRDYFYRVWSAKEAYFKALSPEQQQKAIFSELSYNELLCGNTNWRLFETVKDNSQISLVYHQHTEMPAFKIQLNEIV